MIKIKILCIGNLKENYLLAMQNEYLKRLTNYAKVEIKEENIVSPANELPKEIIKNESLVKNPCIKNVYRGNVIPNIPPQYIKKI